MFGKCSVDFEKLVSFSLGELEGEERTQLEAHLQCGCARCQREVQWLGTVLQTMRSDDSLEPPEWVVRRAARTFAQRHPVQSRGIPVLAKIAAQLLFDSRLAAAPVAIRASGPAPRQLLYAAGDLDIDLQIEASERQSEFTLMGQILPSEGQQLARVAGADVQLLRGHRKLLAKTTDAFGEFVFGRLPAGKYNLRIRVSGMEVELAGIDL